MINHRSTIQGDAATTSPRAASAGIWTTVGRAWRSARASWARMVIRGQLGPSVGYPNDRRPEPPF